MRYYNSFNTQPCGGGCEFSRKAKYPVSVSTHSRAEAAAHSFKWNLASAQVSTHSHPKVAAQYNDLEIHIQDVSTHSHPKVAAIRCPRWHRLRRGFNTQPPEGGCKAFLEPLADRLVSTHSHPKVAAVNMFLKILK